MVDILDLEESVVCIVSVQLRLISWLRKSKDLSFTFYGASKVRNKLHVNF